MALRIAIQMDPPENLNPATDSTLALAEEAQARGHLLWWFPPVALSVHNGCVTAAAQSLRLDLAAQSFAELGPVEPLDLHTVDIVLMRQEPPFDMAYLTATYLLERLAPDTRVINNPTAVRNFPEKLLPLHFPAHLPDTLISRDVNAINAFQKTHRDIVIKPLFSYGGRNVFHLHEQEENAAALMETLLSSSPDPLIAQRFLPEVREQEIRVLMLDGEVAAAIGRIPAAGDIRANMRVGAKAVKAELNAAQRAICKEVGVLLKREGLFFTGLDLIGNYLIEVNTTCPTGIRPAESLTGIAVHKLFWDNLESSRR